MRFNRPLFTGIKISIHYTEINFNTLSRHNNIHLCTCVDCLRFKLFLCSTNSIAYFPAQGYEDGFPFSYFFRKQ